MLRLSAKIHFFADPLKEVLSGKGIIEYLNHMERHQDNDAAYGGFFPVRFQDDSRVVFSLLLCYNLYIVSRCEYMMGKKPRYCETSYMN